MSTEKEWRSPSNVGGIAFWLAFSYLLVVPTLAAVMLGAAVAAVLGAVGALALIATRLPDLVRLKAFGLEAQLERRIEEADELIVKLRKLAVVVAEPSLAMLGTQGHMFLHISERRKYEMRETINQALVDLGVPSREVKDANEEFDELFRVVLNRCLFKGVAEERPDMRDRLSELVLESDDPDRLQVLLESEGLLTEKRKSVLEQYRHFLKHGTITDPSILEPSS